MKKHTFFIKMLSVLLALLLTVFVVPATVYADVIDMVTEAFHNDSSDAPTPETSPSDVDSLLTRVGDDVFEDTDLREENVKHFRLADGSYSAYLYDMPVHILDKNGKWQDIDNTLEDTNQEIATSDARIKFAKKITGNQTIFTLHEGNHKLTLSLDGAIKKTVGKATNTETEFDESATLLQKLTTLDHLTSRIIYENILDGVDIEYVIQSRNIKENIIVKESKDSYSYTFTLALNNLSATLADDGSITLSDSESNDAVYTIPAPTATDADGSRAPSGKVYYTLTDLGNHNYSLTVTVDADWMNHDDRSFPVTIDPPISVAGGSNVIDTNISTAYPDVTDVAGDPHNWVSSSGSYQTYWRAFQLPELPPSAHLINATYTASFWYPSSTSGKIGAYAVTTNWDSTLNWTKAHAGTSPQGDVGDRCYDYVDISYTYNEKDKYESFSLDLTALVKAWRENDLPNYGICLKVLENTTYTGTARIVSNDFVFEKDEQSDNSDEDDQSDNSDENNNPDKSAHKPQLVISYRFIDGIENYWSTFSQSAGNAGTGNVNLCLGYLNHTFYGPTTTDGLLPYTFTLNYNSNYTYSSDLQTSDTNLVGYVWTADFEQRILPVNTDNETNDSDNTEKKTDPPPICYIWKDPDGTEHTFLLYQTVNSSYLYLDEDGLGLRLRVYIAEYNNPNDTQYIMTTRYDETYYFNKAGCLIRYEDAWGNARIFHRTSSYSVDYIALRPAGSTTVITQIEISYNENSNISAITYRDSGKQLRFYYSSRPFPPYVNENEGTLYLIEYHTSKNSQNPFATVEYEYQYYSYRPRLIDAYDSFSNTGITYTWNDYKVTHVSGYSWTDNGEAISEQTEITYDYNGEDKTVCRTRGNDDILSVYDNESDDLLTHYFFDDYGRTTGTYVTDASEEIIYGTSQTQYTETSQESPQANNRVSHQAVSGQIPINLIKNGSFLSNVSNWTSSNADVSLYSDDSYEKALSFKPSASGTARVYQTVTLLPGEYTFSANLRLSSVSGQGKARLSITNTANTLIASSDYLNAPAAVANVGDYVNMSVTFTVPDSTTHAPVTYRVGMELTTTRISDTLYVDDVALGKSSTPSAVSMLSDGSFDATSGVWYGQNITPLFNNYQFDGDTRSLGINNTSATDAYVYQTLTLLTAAEKADYQANSSSYSGAAQAYLLSGYAKADSPSAKDDRVFALRAQVTYLKPNGNLYTDEWIDIPFDPYCTEWQFTSGSFTTDPQKGCPYQIKIACSYKNNVGNAYFDNIVLTKSFDSVDYAYNSQGSVTKTVNNGNGTSVKYEYDTTGVDVTIETHSNGTVIERTYQNHAVLAERIYGGMVALPDTYNTYNSYGQLVSSLVYEDESYTITDYVYSTEDASWGKLDTEISPLGETVYIYSDAAFDYGLLLAVLDENGTGSFYTYDALGRQIEVVPYVNYNFVSNSESVTMEYSGSELVSIETASTEYNFTYNDFGVNTDINVGTNKIVRYLYNSYNGKLRYVVYANGYIERYDYDALDRLTSIWYYEGGSITATEDTIEGYSYDQLCEYVYDSEGNLVEYIDNITSVHERYRYQADGKLASTCRYKINNNDTMVLSDVVVYTYDAYHNPSGSRYATLLNGRSYTRTTAVSYDSLNRVTGFSDNGVTSGYTYHLLGMTESASLSLGNTLIQYAYAYETTPNSLYDDLPMQTGRLESVTSTLKQGSTTRESNTFAYTYDDHDNITEIRIDGVLKYSYEYDHLDQLIRENNKVANKTYLYTYDNAGNLLSKQIFPYNSLVTDELMDAPAEATYTYTYENANWGDRLSSYRGAPFSYDSLGNPTNYYNGSSYVMQWQNGRQLEKVIKGSSTYTFTYDAEGRRTSKRWSSGRVIQYVWDGDLLIGEYVVGQETITYSYDASGSPVGFTYTDLTGYYEGGIPCSFLYRKNPQGDIIGIVDSSGNEFVKYNYDAWGNLISYTMHGDNLYSLHYNMAEGNSFRYRGYYFDRETGFYYLKSRYYDPKIGRFLNADSQLNGSILGYNQYAYCENNPVMYFDPTGTMPTWLAGVLAVGAGIIAGVAVVTMLPASLCAVGATTIIYGTTISSIAVGTAGVVGTVAAVSTAAYTADSMYQAMTGESFLLDTVFQGNADLYAAGAFFTSAATMGLSYFASLGINNGVCFVAGTLVQGENGSLPIEEIKEGMLVYAHHPETGESALKEVVRTFVRESNELVHIAVNGEQILTTPEHPFWVPEKGWTSAIHLRAGDRLQRLNGEYVVVEQVQHELLEAPITVYNFEVEDFHTYYVTDSAILVHNMCDYNTPKGGGGVSESITVGNTTVEFGHGGRHLNQYGLSATQVNSKIAQDVVTRPPSGVNASTAFVDFNGVTIKYSYFTRSSTLINVGTSVVVFPE